MILRTGSEDVESASNVIARGGQLRWENLS